MILNEFNDMKQQIKRAEKNLQDALKLISEDNIEKDLLHDYVFDALKAVENFNLDDVINGFYDWHKGKGYITLKRDDFEEYLNSLKK